MVITCPECATKFRVNPDRIPERGAKVRCARCKHIFFTPKTTASAAPAAAEPVTDAAPAPPPPPVPAEDHRLAMEDSNDRFGGLDDGFDEPASGESDFNYEQFHELDAKSPAKESFSFSASEPAAAQAKPQVKPQAAESDDFSFGDLPQAAATASAAAAATAEEDHSSASAASYEADDELAEPALTTAPTAKKGSLWGSLVRILLLLVLGVLLLGGVLVYMHGPEAVQQNLQQLLGQQQGGQSSGGEIVLSKLQGMFVNNQEAGELFVIRGEAINKFKESRASIQVKGIIFDQSGKPLLQKTIFCGNQLTDQELQTLPFGKIEEMMGNQFGKSLSNMNVNSEQAIPFTIVFRDLPKNLTEFSVDVTTSKPAAQ